MEKCQIKTKNQIGNKLFLKYSFFIIGGILLFVLPIIHIDFPKKNVEVEAYKTSLDKKINNIKIKIKNNRTAYDEGIIDAKKYIHINDKLLISLDKQSKINTKLYRDKVDSVRIFGWKTMRIFLVGLGIRLPYLFYSLIISYLITLIPQKNNFLKKALFFLQLASYTISFYLLIWCFWTSQDYPLHIYRVAIIILCTLASFLSIYFVKYLNRKQNAIKSLLYLLSDFNKIKIRKEKLNNYYNTIYLSKREKEIAEMLHSGINDYNFISNSLVISYKTVTSHTSNIFKKANVTSKQEFIDLRGKLLQ